MSCVCVCVCARVCKDRGFICLFFSITNEIDNMIPMVFGFFSLPLFVRVRVSVLECLASWLCVWQDLRDRRFFSFQSRR